MTRVPAHVLLALWLCATGLALCVALTATQPESGAGSEQPCPITGLVLDGGPTTTAAVSSARRPVEPIPYRQIGDPTTEKEQRCG